MWTSSFVAVGFALVLPLGARADAPETTVVFGTPALAMATVELPPAEAPRPDAPPAARPSEGACPRPVTVTRRIGGRRERVRMPLLDCDGTPRPEALRALSILARPRSVEAAPTEAQMRAWAASGGDPNLLAPYVRLLHPGLLERLQRIGEVFAPHPIEIKSGYRPTSRPTSRHHHGRALDLVVNGVSREALRDLAVTFEQTGVGWYPNSVFVHVDVREDSAYWVDVSGPGERPRYVRGAEPPEVGSPPQPDPSAAELDLGALDAIHVPRPTGE